MAMFGRIRFLPNLESSFQGRRMLRDHHRRQSQPEIPEETLRMSDFFSRQVRKIFFNQTL
jgi:hypothetical protein